MRLRPVRSQVLVQLDPIDSHFEGGVLVRPDVAKERPHWGTVKAAGSGAITRKGAVLPADVRIGDRVCIPWGVGSETYISGVLHMWVSEDDILLVESASDEAAEAVG